MIDKRTIAFIRALRANRVRISLAESQDAMNSIDSIGVSDSEAFRLALKTTLIKAHSDQQLFDYFFPLFFSGKQAPLENINEQLTPEQQQMMQQATEALAGNKQALQKLIDQLLSGQPFSDDQLSRMGERTGLNDGQDMSQRGRMERRMERESGLARMEQLIQALMDMLEEMGMGDDDRAQIEQMLRENLQGLADQISQHVGQTLAERMAEQTPEARPDLSDQPFQHLSARDMDAIRDEIRKLAARLRSRASMRQRRANSGQFDPRRTIRANLRYGGVPIEMKTRTRHKKPSLVVICDVSTSMRPYVEFLLTLVYTLQDQVRRTHSFLFIDDLVDISDAFHEHEPQPAIRKVLMENPPGYYNTDLGSSLSTFVRDHMSTLDSRTTVIILGDGRNNFNDPRYDLADHMRRHARRVLWFCPEPEMQWGTGDSDMIGYARRSDGVYCVNTLRDLANAVDEILADG